MRGMHRTADVLFDTALGVEAHRSRVGDSPDGRDAVEALTPQHEQQRLHHRTASDRREQHRQEEQTDQEQQDGLAALRFPAVVRWGFPMTTLIRWNEHDVTFGRRSSE